MRWPRLHWRAGGRAGASGGTPRPLRRLAALLLWPVTGLGGVACPASAEDAAGPVGDVAVIAHAAVVADSITRTQLLDFYSGDIQRWSDGTRVVVKDLKAKGEVRDRFYRFLEVRPSRMKSIWLRKMLSGEGEPPESMETEEEMVARVAATPGALGFVRRSRATEAVKVLRLIPADEPGTAQR